MLIGFAKRFEIVGAATAWTTKGIFDGFAILMVEVAEATEVMNGCVLGLPVVSRLVTAVPVVIGAWLGFGRSWVPMERTSLGFAAGATADAGAEATKGMHRASRTGIVNGIVQEIKLKRLDASQT